MHRTSDGALRTASSQGRFLASLAPHCRRLTCLLHTPVLAEQLEMDYLVEESNVDWVDLGPHESVPKRLVRARTMACAVEQMRGSLDLLLIRAPSPLLPALARAAGPLPLALLVVGDYLASKADLNQPWWRKKMIHAWFYWNSAMQARVAQRALTIVNSRALYNQLSPTIPNLHELPTTTLRNEDFADRDDTCQERPYRVLYTGRIDRAKGLFELIEAISRLVDQGEDLVLDLVGSPQRGDRVGEELRTYSKHLGIQERVVFHGFRSLENDLLDYYREADCHVTASYAEGFPRTIWEAMANSLPVVATTVGSIPFYLQDEESALLVPPRDVQRLADAIGRLIHEGYLRRKLIANGRRLARRNTLEQRGEELMELLKKWARARKQGHGSDH